MVEIFKSIDRSFPIKNNIQGISKQLAIDGDFMQYLKLDINS
jgi:hypothetical protein